MFTGLLDRWSCKLSLKDQYLELPLRYSELTCVSRLNLVLYIIPRPPVAVSAQRFSAWGLWVLCSQCMHMTNPLNPLLVEKDETKTNSVGNSVLQVVSMGTGGINQKKRSWESLYLASLCESIQVNFLLLHDGFTLWYIQIIHFGGSNLASLWMCSNILFFYLIFIIYRIRGNLLGLGLANQFLPVFVVLLEYSHSLILLTGIVAQK